MVLTPQLLQAIKLCRCPTPSSPPSSKTSWSAIRCSSAPTMPAVDGPGEAARRPNRRRPPSSPATGPPTRSKPTRPRSPGISAPKSTTPSTPTAPRRPPSAAPPDEGQGLSATSWTGVAGRGGEDGAPDLEAYVAAPESFGEHLTRQAMIALPDPVDRMIAAALIDALDEAGYLTGAARGNRRAARRAARARRSGADAPADAGADRRVRAQSRRMPEAATDRARPVRSGHAGADRQFAAARQARSRRAAPRSAASTTRTSPT